jgi:CRP-like cAMP-binding protein
VPSLALGRPLQKLHLDPYLRDHPVNGHDRVGSDEFPLTQEFLAQMLGVRRPSVTVVAGILQQAGFIRFHRAGSR